MFLTRDRDWFIFSRIKKGEGQGKEKCHAKSMMSNEDNERLKRDTHHVVEHGGKSTRDGAKNGVGRHKRMKCGRRTQDREERSKGIEIHIVDVFGLSNRLHPSS